MKNWTRIAESYDGGFTEMYLDLYKCNTGLVIKGTSYHYNAGAEKKAVRSENSGCYQGDGGCSAFYSRKPFIVSLGKNHFGRTQIQQGLDCFY